LLTVLGWLVYKPLSVSNVTAAALYRVVEQSAPTLLVDECDTYLEGNDEMTGLLNSGHTKPLAFVLRASPNGAVQRFSTWAAKAVAMIGQLSPTIADRSVPIRLARRGKAEIVQPLRTTKWAEVETLRRKIARWTIDNREEVAFAEPAPPDLTNDRAADNWHPLFKIAEVAGGDWPALASKALNALNAVEHDEDSFTTVLLVALADAFEEENEVKPDGFIATEVILVRLNANEQAPWADWRNGQGMSAKKLGEFLRRYGVKSIVRRTDPLDPKSRRNGYLWQAISPALERYVPARYSTLSPSPKPL
jgi:putative DNA primase/helicase